MSVVNSYNLFIDTERNLSNDSTGDQVQLPLGESPIMAGNNQQIRLSLTEFTMPKSWYNVNSSNNKLVVRTNLGEATATIDAGNYSNFNQLVEGRPIASGTKVGGVIDAIVTALTSLETATGTWTGVDNIFQSGANFQNSNGVLDVTFSFSGTTNLSNIIIQCYVAQGRSHQITGGKKIFDIADTTTSSFNMTPGTNTFTMQGYYNMMLATDTHLFVRINEQNTNTATSSLAGSGNIDTQRSSMANSNVLAIIPISSPYCHYVAQTDNVYFTNILAKQVAQMRVFVTDSLGQPFPLMNADQGRQGNRYFTAVIRIDIVENHASIPHSTHQHNKQEKTPARFSTQPATRVGIVESSGLNGGAATGQQMMMGDGFFGVSKMRIT